MIWLRFYVIDTELFRQDGDWVLLWRIKDFASNVLVLKLALLDTVKKIFQLEGKDKGSVAIVCVSLYFLRVRL